MANKIHKINLDPNNSEKKNELELLFTKGVEVFGNSEKFYNWLNSNSLALGGIKPVSLLDNTLGKMMLKDELTRIEHGILA